ncbi:hypothetical protein AMAG_02780 [Allomyces macrogynus ATCC 38327]|uniref:DH domain-containing protein n=1 Tax=Allomyces macrogynus (strain ATCC 38327) TaxID=578462 RepID=A0A0L0S3Q0_ALLM3|nr:hypothetical protein AMAG_02780 [Allomyces macrogynus ATCC 38327]|eukprot:KNE57020.1 hypothetical protein AMAG_02780 [Allomyces macrogynus ATCC 38327]
MAPASLPDSPDASGAPPLTIPVVQRRAVTGHFAGSQWGALLLTTNGAANIQLYQIDPHSFTLIKIAECFLGSNIHGIERLRVGRASKDYILAALEGGTILILEYMPATVTFEQLDMERYQFTHHPWLLWGRNMTADWRSRCVIIGNVEDCKIVYILVDPVETKLSVALPMVDALPHSVLYSIVSVEMTWRNPVFACLEAYRPHPQDAPMAETAAAATASREEAIMTGAKRLVYFELDLEQNQAVRRWDVPVDRSANMVVPVPGDHGGPGGVLVCSRNQVVWTHERRSPQVVPIPRHPSLGLEPDLYLVSYTTVLLAAPVGSSGDSVRSLNQNQQQQQPQQLQPPPSPGSAASGGAKGTGTGGGAMILAQSIFGDVYALEFKNDILTIKFFDAIPQSEQLFLLNNRFLVACSLFEYPRIYYLLSVTDDEDPDQLVYSAMEPTKKEDAFFRPRPLRHLTTTLYLTSAANARQTQLTSRMSICSGAGIVRRGTVAYGSPFPSAQQQQVGSPRPGAPYGKPANHSPPMGAMAPPNSPQSLQQYAAQGPPSPYMGRVASSPLAAQQQQQQQPHMSPPSPAYQQMMIQAPQPQYPPGVIAPQQRAQYGVSPQRAQQTSPVYAMRPTSQQQAQQQQQQQQQGGYYSASTALAAAAQYGRGSAQGAAVLMHRHSMLVPPSAYQQQQQQQQAAAQKQHQQQQQQQGGYYNWAVPPPSPAGTAASLPGPAPYGSQRQSSLAHRQQVLVGGRAPSLRRPRSETQIMMANGNLATNPAYRMVQPAMVSKRYSSLRRQSSTPGGPAYVPMDMAGGARHSSWAPAPSPYDPQQMQQQQLQPHPSPALSQSHDSGLSITSNSGSSVGYGGGGGGSAVSPKLDAISEEGHAAGGRPPSPYTPSSPVLDSAISMSDLHSGGTASPQPITPPPSAASTVPLTPMSESDEKRRRNMELRGYIAHEVYETEKSYCELLGVLWDHIRTPIAEQKICSDVFTRIVFTGIPALLQFSRTFAAELEQVVANWDDTTHLAPVFLAHRDDFSVFLKFVDNYSTALSMVRSAEQSNLEFRAFNERCKHAKETHRQQIQDFLILPIQRATRYPLLIKDVRKHTPLDHPDYEDLSVALDLMNEMAAQVNLVKQQEEEMTRIFSMFNQMEGCPATVIKYSRRVIMEADVGDASSSLAASLASAVSGIAAIKPTYRLVLMSDLLLLAKLHKKKYKFNRLIDLADIKVGDDPSASSSSSSSSRNLACRIEIANGSLSSHSSTLINKHQVDPNTTLPSVYTFLFLDEKTRHSFVLALSAKIRATQDQRQLEGNVFSLPRGLLGQPAAGPGAAATLARRGDGPRPVSMAGPVLPVSVPIPGGAGAASSIAGSNGEVTTPVMSRHSGSGHGPLSGNAAASSTGAVLSLAVPNISLVPPSPPPGPTPTGARRTSLIVLTGGGDKEDEPPKESDKSTKSVKSTKSTERGHDDDGDWARRPSAVTDVSDALSFMALQDEPAGHHHRGPPTAPAADPAGLDDQGPAPPARPDEDDDEFVDAAEFPPNADIRQRRSASMPAPPTPMNGDPIMRPMTDEPLPSPASLSSRVSSAFGGVLRRATSPSGPRSSAVLSSPSVRSPPHTPTQHRSMGSDDWARKMSWTAAAMGMIRGGPSAAAAAQSCGSAAAAQGPE